MNKNVVIGIIIAAMVVAGGLVAWYIMKDDSSDTTTDVVVVDESKDEKSDDSMNQSTQPADSVDGDSEGTMDTDQTAAMGRYEMYSAEKASEKGYEKTILFFHAPWCPECKAFDDAINNDTVPGGVQILKVDFDTATELRKKHNVSQQTTFVRVNEAGEQQAKWSGNGADKSVKTILESL